MIFFVLVALLLLCVIFKMFFAPMKFYKVVLGKNVCVAYENFGLWVADWSKWNVSLEVQRISCMHPLEAFLS